MDKTKKRLSRNIFPGDGRVNGERIRKVCGDMSCGSWMQPRTTLIRTGWADRPEILWKSYAKSMSFATKEFNQ